MTKKTKEKLTLYEQRLNNHKHNLTDHNSAINAAQAVADGALKQAEKAIELLDKMGMHGAKADSFMMALSPQELNVYKLLGNLNKKLDILAEELGYNFVEIQPGIGLEKVPITIRKK